jgi:hypothetical protein
VVKESTCHYSIKTQIENKQPVNVEKVMADPALNLEERVHRYTSRTGRQMVGSLGFGHDGDVYSTNIDSAVKFFRDPAVFQCELRCYQRLQEHGVAEILGHAVPELVAWDEELLALEMSMVRRPYLLDFASASLDWAPDFPPEVIEEWSQRKAKEFGKHWPKVQLILAILADRYGVCLTDIHRGNIAFDSDDWGECSSSS